MKIYIEIYSVWMQGDYTATSSHAALCKYYVWVRVHETHEHTHIENEMDTVRRSTPTTIPM